MNSLEQFSEALDVIAARRRREERHQLRALRHENRRLTPDVLAAVETPNLLASLEAWAVHTAVEMRPLFRVVKARRRDLYRTEVLRRLTNG